MPEMLKNASGNMEMVDWEAGNTSWAKARYSHSHDNGGGPRRIGEVVASRLSGQTACVVVSGRLAVPSIGFLYRMAREEGARQAPNQGRWDGCGGRFGYHVEGLEGKRNVRRQSPAHCHHCA